MSAAAVVALLGEVIAKRGIVLTDLRPADGGLEDLFLSLTHALGYMLGGSGGAMIALGLLATDALTRLKPGPLLRVVILVVVLAAVTVPIAFVASSIAPMGRTDRYVRTAVMRAAP